MATKLCCTAEEDDRSSSPELPNGRPSEVTPAKRPLLHSRTGSHGSHFTSARSEDLHELRQIFNSVHGADTTDTSPKKANRARFVRPSVYSLHSLHKIKSVQALLGRKRSRELAKRSGDTHGAGGSTKKTGIADEAETVLRTPKQGQQLEFKRTKSDLKRDLLSDKKADEGGYDSDAEVLDDVAKKFAKPSPSKRPSLHSIDWTPSSRSVRTPESNKGRRISLPAQSKARTTPRHSGTPGTNRFSNVFSSPNLRIRTPQHKNRKLKRSHSATSVDIATSSTLANLRLPSIMADDGVTWAESMHESLRLSRFNTPPPGAERTPTRVLFGKPEGTAKSEQHGPRVFASAIHVAAVARPSPRCFSEPLRPKINEQVLSPAPVTTKANKKEEPSDLPRRAAVEKEDGVSKEDHPRSSVHLPEMHISRHLRSASLLSWDKVADAAHLPPVPPIFRERTISEHSRSSQQASRSRHHRQTSSTGFASARVPSKWGNVVAHNPQREDMSSIYSSRPHSPPDSFGGSMANLSLPRTAESILEVPRSRSNNCLTDNEETPRPSRLGSGTPVELPRSASNNYLSENDETPRPIKRHGLLNPETVMKDVTKETVNGAGLPKIARKNSVATTKKSKFREEFSPTPPRKRSTPTISFMKILRHRNEVRSQSEANLRSAKMNMSLDGSHDDIQVKAHRERAMSQSLMSMQKEQESFGREKEANPVWQKALKSYQEEKSSLLLPGNRALAGQTSPFRERSSSVSVRAKSTHSLTPAASRHDLDPSPSTTRPHTPFEGPTGGSTFPSKTFLRRAALVHADDERPDSVRALQMAFDKQTDTMETVGAWGRYPSHTRHERTGSAGHADSVKTRDFALEAAIHFAKGKDMEESVDPTARPESPTEAGGRKRKKRVGSGRMAKSASMTFRKTFIKNYAKRFRSQSTEFHRHGYGHRSSIAAGGVLEHPELEVLPQLWDVPIAEDKERERSREEQDGPQSEAVKESLLNFGNDQTHSPMAKSQDRSDAPSKGKGKQKTEDSAATLRPPRPAQRNMIALDGVADTETATDRARVWSVYYEECIAPYPRASTDLASISQPNLRAAAADSANQTINLSEFGALAVNSHSTNRGTGTGAERASFDSKHTSVRSMSMKSYTVPRRYRHSRHASHLSRVSVASRASIVTSFVSSGVGGDGCLGSSGDGECGGDARSLASVGVRRSTMDLLNVYREQEIAERERVLSLMRGESIRVA